MMGKKKRMEKEEKREEMEGIRAAEGPFMAAKKFGENHVFDLRIACFHFIQIHKVEIQMKTFLFRGAYLKIE